MSRSKKIVGLVLAVVLMLGSLTMAFAATDPGAGKYTATVAVTPAAASIAAGESTTVSVKATTNFTVGALSVPLFYEKANVTLSNIAVPATAGYAYSTDATASNAASVFASAGLDSATYGFVMVTYIPAAGAATKVFADEQVLSFTVTANAGVADGTAVNFKTVEASRKTSTKPTGTLYVGFINSDTINAVPTNIEATGLVTSSTVTIGSAAAPELQLSERGQEIGAVISKTYAVADGYAGCVMGIDTLGLGYDGVMATLAESLTTPAGSIEIDTSATGGVETTGTLIKLLDEGGNVLETYVFIYFGDVNMDGVVDSSDNTTIVEYEYFVVDIPEEYRLLAADVNGDMSPDSSDGTMIVEYEYFVIEALPTQANVAAVYA